MTDDDDLGPGIMCVQGVVVSWPSLTRRVKALLRTGGDLNHNGHLQLRDGQPEQENPNKLTLLHLAVHVKHVAMVRALLEGGADPHKQDKKETKPLAYACLFDDNEEVVRLLLAAEAKVSYCSLKKSFFKKK